MIKNVTSIHYRPCVLWFTGLSGAGKSTTAAHLTTLLDTLACRSYWLDGDVLRQGLCSDLGFTEADRNENIRRIGEVAKLMMEAGLIVIAATISPFKSMRDAIRTRFADGDFIEVFIDSPLAVCEARDPKGLYRKARAGELKQFTGVSSGYDVPLKPDLHLRTDQQSPTDCAQQIVAYLQEQGYLPRTA